VQKKDSRATTPATKKSEQAPKSHPKMKRIAGEEVVIILLLSLSMIWGIDFSPVFIWYRFLFSGVQYKRAWWRTRW